MATRDGSDRCLLANHVGLPADDRENHLHALDAAEHLGIRLDDLPEFFEGLLRFLESAEGESGFAFRRGLTPNIYAGRTVLAIATGGEFRSALGSSSESDVLADWINRRRQVLRDWVFTHCDRETGACLGIRFAAPQAT